MCFARSNLHNQKTDRSNCRNSNREATMTTRRNFLKGAGAAGIAFCSCGLLDAARAQGTAPRSTPVMVKGKRIKTVDVHAHCLFHESLNLLGAE
jgi:aminocarboxymuconate-semialdehyde decarboxylase